MVSPLPPDVNLSDFNVPASDVQGHSERMAQFRVAPQLARMVSELLQSGVWPYKTQADFMRHAVVNHLKWLDSVGETEFFEVQFQALMVIMDKMEQDARILDAIDRLDTRVKNLNGRGLQDMARGEVMVVRAHIMGMEDDSPWKKVLLAELENKFGGLLAEAKPVGLFKFE